MASPGIATEFVFDAPTISSVTARTGNISRQGGRTYVEGVTPSTGVALQLHTHSGKRVRIVLLSEQQAENSWKISVGGQAHMLMTLADLFSDDDTIHLRSRNADGLSFSIFPKLDKRARATVPLQKGVSEGIFAHYILRVKPSHPQIKIEPVRDAAPSSPVKLGRYWEWRHSAVAAAPDDKDFEKAAIWRLTFPNTTLQGLSDIFLDIDYVGDAGRLYEGSRLLDDNFYNGTAWEIGLKRYAPQVWDKGLELKILPLRKDAPIYIPKAAWPDFGGKSEIVKAGSISLQAEYEVELNLAGPAR